MSRNSETSIVIYWVFKANIVAEFQNDNIQAQVIQDFVVNTEKDMSDSIFSTDASVMPYRT